MARRRAFIRAALSGAVAVALALGGATTAMAEDEPVAGTGSITGVVTSTVDGSALEGVSVHAETDNGLGSADAVTDETGGYSLDGLVDGDYVVRFSTADASFTAEYWNDTRDQWRAERIAVVDGAAVTGIDAALAPAPTGSISGTVTREDDGTPAAGVTVTAQGWGGGWASTTTDQTGAYTLPGLADDSYVISFFADGTDLKRQYWEDTTDYDSATRIVTDGTAVVGIDASLTEGGAIEGVVTRADDGAPIEGVNVSALDANNEIVGATESDATGEYSLGGLPAGSYRVRFGSPDPALVSEYWKDSYSWNGATLVTVTEKESVGNVDAQLGGVGYISGTVTKSADGSPVSAAVILYDVDNAVEDPSIDTDSEGNYRIAVTPGTYRVLFHAYETGVMEEYWEGAREWEDATFVTVGANEEVEGISAALEVVSTITGTVALDSDEDRKVVVEAWADGELVRTAEANPNTGAYKLVVPEGTYVLKASASFPGSTTTAAPQYFDGVATAAEATPVVAVGRATLTGIDFTLIAGTALEPKPALTLSAASIRAGKEITVSGTGFAPGQKVAFELHSDPVALGSLAADESGALTGSLRLPAGTPAGAHTLVALDASGAVIASVALTVTAASGGAVAGGEDVLATTGAELPSFAVMMAAALLLTGLGLVRRRRAHS